MTRRKFGQVGLHWFGENRQARISIPVALLPKARTYATFRETRQGIMLGFSDVDGYKLTSVSPKTVSACLPLDLSRRLRGLQLGVNPMTPHWRQEGYALWVTLEKQKGG